MKFYGNNFCGLPYFYGHGGIFIMGLIILAVVIAALWLFLVRKKDNKPSCGSAHEILQERLARGEITADEFSKLKTALEENL